ncbi:peroxidase 18-like [Phragmites australis]|uniref:peroxidase 18-like n=1 Tax=Phragmites australis TaxID=29695 RepID=UPI002D79FDC2|nr:peroxidase 18-like [Phragmites australis]
MSRRLSGGAVCSMLVLSALVALAGSQSPSPRPSPAPRLSRPPTAPVVKPSSPPPAVPAPRLSRPPTAPAAKPSSPPSVAPARKPSPSPRPAPTPSPPRAAPTRRPSPPPAASPTPKPPYPPKPSPPTAAPAPRPSPPLASPAPPAAPPAPKPSPSLAPKPSPSPASPPPPAPPQPPPSSSPSTSSSLGQLSPSYYALSCLGVELAVRDVVRSASTLDPTIPGKLLRLVFHDCFVEGCDASVLIQGDGTERTDPANLSLGGFNVIDAAKRLLEVVCPATVSCSDIVVLAARDAVEFTGGPAVPVALGRRDGLVSLASNVRKNIIDTGFSVDDMAASFAAKGLTLDDLVTLSGGHTIGSAHCNTFGERFRVANGSMTPLDGSMNTDYANELIRACSVNGTVSAGTAVDCDSGSASVFDNRYFGNLLDGRGLLRTDAVLVQNATTRAKVAEFAQSQDSFFASWADSYARLTSLGVKTGNDGEIRRICSSVNG